MPKSLVGLFSLFIYKPLKCSLGKQGCGLESRLLEAYLMFITLDHESSEDSDGQLGSSTDQTLLAGGKMEEGRTEAPCGLSSVGQQRRVHTRPLRSPQEGGLSNAGGGRS